MRGAFPISYTWDIVLRIWSVFWNLFLLSRYVLRFSVDPSLSESVQFVLFTNSAPCSFQANELIYCRLADDLGQYFGQNGVITAGKCKYWNISRVIHYFWTRPVTKHKPPVQPVSHFSSTGSKNRWENVYNRQHWRFLVVSECWMLILLGKCCLWISSKCDPRMSKYKNTRIRIKNENWKRYSYQNKLRGFQLIFESKQNETQCLVKLSWTIAACQSYLCSLHISKRLSTCACCNIAIFWKENTIS